MEYSTNVKCGLKLLDLTAYNL